MDEKFVHKLLALPLGERIAVAGEIWDSLADEEIPTPPQALKKMKARLRRHRQNPRSAMTLEQFQKKGNQLNQLVKSLGKNHRKSA